VRSFGCRRYLLEGRFACTLATLEKKSGRAIQSRVDAIREFMATPPSQLHVSWHGSLTCINRGAASTPSADRMISSTCAPTWAPFRTCSSACRVSPSRKPTSAQRAKCLAMRRHRLRIHLGAIASAIGMLKAQSRRHATLDSQKAPVQSLVVRAAQNHQSILVVIASFRAEHEVMNVDEGCVMASWHDAATAIAKHDATPHRRRDVLMGAGRPRFARTHVGAAV
jgi:hypothetical protein